jgi:hypothetical protein
MNKVAQQQVFPRPLAIPPKLVFIFHKKLTQKTHLRSQYQRIQPPIHWALMALSSGNKAAKA